jgi:hypothetical protein
VIERLLPEPLENQKESPANQNGSGSEAEVERLLAGQTLAVREHPTMPRCLKAKKGS